VSPQANQEFEQALQSVSRGIGPSYRRRLMREAQKGYGREFSPVDKADWENLIEGLMWDIKEMRRLLVQRGIKA